MNKRMKLMLVGLVLVLSAFSPAETELYTLLNEARADAGVQPIELLAEQSEYARQWSEHMAGIPDLYHRPTDQWQGSGLRAQNVGVSHSVVRMHNAFVASDGHYRNMVNPDLTYVGIGVVESGGRYWATIEFSSSPIVTAAPQPSAEPEPTAEPTPEPTNNPDPVTKPTNKPEPRRTPSPEPSEPTVEPMLKDNGLVWWYDRVLR